MIFCVFSKQHIIALFIFHQYDFQTYASDRFQCFKSHGMFDFAYKLQLHYNIYRLVLQFGW